MKAETQGFQTSPVSLLVQAAEAASRAKHKFGIFAYYLKWPAAGADFFLYYLKRTPENARARASRKFQKWFEKPHKFLHFGHHIKLKKKTKTIPALRAGEKRIGIQSVTDPVLVAA